VYAKPVNTTGISLLQMHLVPMHGARTALLVNTNALKAMPTRALPALLGQLLLLISPHANAMTAPLILIVTRKNVPAQLASLLM